MKLLLGKIVHNFPHACLTSHADAAEAFALTVGSVLVELDLQEVSHSEVLDIVLYILVSGPPGQVADVQLPLLVETTSPVEVTPGHLGLLLLGSHHGTLFLLFITARSDNVIVEIIVLC